MATSSGSVVMLVITPGHAFDRAGRAAGMPADDLDALRRPPARSIGACSRASIVPRMMPSGCSAIAWVSAEARVDGAPWPSRRRNSQPIAFGRFLGAVADALRAAVALVVRHVDDELVRLRLRAGGRAGPFGHRRGDRLDIGLRLRHEGVVLRPGAAGAQPEDRGRGEKRPTGHTKSRHTRFLPCACWQAARRLVRPVHPAR